MFLFFRGFVYWCGVLVTTKVITFWPYFGLFFRVFSSVKEGLGDGLKGVFFETSFSRKPLPFKLKRGKERFSPSSFPKNLSMINKNL